MEPSHSRAVFRLCGPTLADLGPVAQAPNASGVRRVKARGCGPPVAQSRSSTVWTTGMPVPEPICIMQPMLPAAMTWGAFASSVRTLRALQLGADLGLQKVVGSGRAAAEMAVGGFHHLEPGALQQVLRRGFDLLAVLQAAGGVIGHAQALRRALRQAKGREDLADVLGEPATVAASSAKGSLRNMWP